MADLNARDGNNAKTETSSNEKTNNFFSLGDDCWNEIISYLDLKSIYRLEKSSKYFEDLMSKTRLWSRKLKIEYPNALYENILKDKSDYKLAREVYWSIFNASHVCHICKICLCHICKICIMEEICTNIPNCEKCDWIKYLD